MHYNCLIVDDEIELAKATAEYFEMFDVSCQWVSTSDACEKFLEENQVDILLLDINLSEESGFVLCKKIRKTMNIPILFISARQTDDDILMALNIGGDDYIKKPYTLSVLLAKVKVMLRRMVTAPETTQEQDGAITLEPSTMSVKTGGEKIPLKAKEYKLFSYLYENKNRIITKDELFRVVWGDAFYSDGTLNVHIRKLREKLEKNPNEPEMIKTIWGTGYMLQVDDEI